ncbi:two-component system sensor histidine kinase YesM [Paenibacillus endophyticus]|uniref:histidine kinase n=1 Tax=Paenibacillus endophyticus TaxID=1294268 RepID=A0A7W5C4B1_9BACL|nr:sensor histidine kinase [Paenibacillus endophyticus]MBB3150495.1 two-component system sensor histidine kinase YesM [Paenibacillus endophyticus]
MSFRERFSWYNYSIKFKITFLLLVSCILCTFVTGYLINHNYSTAVLRDYQATSNEATSRLGYQLDYYLEQVEHSTWNMIGDLKIQRWLEETGEANREIEDGVLNTLETYRIFNSWDIAGLWVVSKDGRTVSSVTDFEIPQAQYTNTSTRVSIVRQSGYYRNEVFPLISISMPIYSIYNGRLMGHLVLNLEFTELKRLFTDTKLGQSGKFYVINKHEGKTVFHPNQAFIGMFIQDTNLSELDLGFKGNAAMQTIQHTSMLIGTRDMPSQDWTIVSVVPLDEMASGLKAAKRTTIIIMVVILLLVLLVVPALAKRFVAPIGRLMSAVNRMEHGDLKVRTEFHPGPDEIQILSMKFNRMTDRLVTLIDEVMNLSKKEMHLQNRQNEASIQALQNQINPHFLYNTLDIIKSIAYLERNQRVVEMTHNLADFYRYTASVREKEVTLAEELKALEQYLTIIHIRFPDEFTSEVLVNEKYYGCRMVKLTLQPLVENAIKYAIEPRGGEGVIRISAYSDKEKLIIEVMDNGPGLPEHLLRTLKKRLDRVVSDPDSYRGEGSYGLVNVHSRLHLQYGEGYGLRLHTFEGRGTVVTVTIPLTHH